MGAGASASNPLYDEAKSLVNILATSKSSAERVEALKKLDKWAEMEQHKAPLCHPALGFVDQLMRLLRSNPTKDELQQIIYVFIDLSQGYDNKAYLGSAELGLGKEFVKLLPEDNVYNTFTNLVMRHETHSYLFSKDVGLMDHVMTKVSSFQRDTREKEVLSCKILANAAGVLREANLDLFMSYQCHTPMIQRLKMFTKEEIQKATNNVAYWCLNYVLRFSHFPAAADAMRSQVSDFIESITVPNTMVGLKCAIISANLTGRQEATASKQTLLQSSPDTVRLLLTLLKSTLNLDQGPEGEELRKLGGHVFGGIKMRNTVGAVRTLSISDTNKPLLLKTNVLILLMQTLHLFTTNAPELRTLNKTSNLIGSSGGGGDDNETAELTIEALLQLAFNYETDEQLQNMFLTREAFDQGYDLVKMLTECVADPRGLLRSETKRNASSLLARLTKHTSSSITNMEAPPSPTKGGAAKHIMLSYSWAVNKPLVVALGSRLKQLGHEVWRDEEGNSIVGPMQGDTDEKMAAAVEASHTVVICVSPQYKESANCRMEAKYSRQRQISHSLRIVYVMMNENYTTRSNPPVDGWLALNIGTDLWYPLWNASFINSTAQAISDLLGSGGGAMAPAVVSPVVIQPPAGVTAASSPQKNVETAWSILEKNTSSAEAVDALGLSEKDDLNILKENEIRQLAATLKPVPQRKFLAAMGLEEQ